MISCGAYTEDKHVCMLPQEAQCLNVPPTAGFHRRLLCRIRELTMAAEWHHGSALFLRSQRRLKQERERQLAQAHWLVWHPYSALKYYWDWLYLSLTYVVFLYMPLQVFYNCPDPYDPFILTCDAFAFLNICIKFISGHDPEDGRSVTLNLKEIAKKYLYSTFILDLISALPLQCIEVFADCNHPTHTVWFIVKIFRIISLRMIWQNIYKQLGMSYVSSSAMTVFSHCVLFYHWMTYVHFQVPTIFAHFYPVDGLIKEHWFIRVHLTANTSRTVVSRYMENLFLVCAWCNGVGNYSPVSGLELPEMLLNSAFGILGLLFLTHLFTTLLRLALYSRFEMFLYSGRLKELDEYMVFKALPKPLQQKIRLFLNYKFNEHYFNEQAILNTINDQIKQDISMHCCKKLVMNVPLFQEMPLALINTIVFSLVRLLFMPGEVVVTCNKPGDSLYLIASGTVAVINASGREVAHLSDGGFFGESALLKPGMPRPATIIALEITEMYKLSTNEFQWCLQPYPHLKRRLALAAARRAVPARRRRRVLA